MSSSGQRQLDAAAFFSRRFLMGCATILLAQGAHAAELLPRPSSVRPGDGHPGRLESYEAYSTFEEKLKSFQMEAWWFARDSVDPSKHPPPTDGCPERLPFLLFRPERGMRPLPMVIYFGGTGQHGEDLERQFSQARLFRKLTSPTFQERHPSYLFAPMLPKGAHIRSGLPETPSALAALVCDAMYAVIREAKSPPVDVKRIYLTGLSYGGSAAFELPCAYPGRFAASVPVSSFQTAFMIPKRNPGNYWLIYNEEEYQDPGIVALERELASAVRSRGGEFRFGRYPGGGHNAWDKAWAEDCVWDWMFSKRSDANLSFGPPGRWDFPSPLKSSPTLTGPKCTASHPPVHYDNGPERGADLLHATYYMSWKEMKKGDWWMVEYPKPFSGKVTVYTGRPSGAGVLSRGRVETSGDGRIWGRRGVISRDTGSCSFTQHEKARFLRILPEPAKPEILIVREVEVEP